MNIEILLVAILAASATSLIGVFLVLRKLSMMTDALSHTILLGIVLMFMLVRSLTSPWLLVGATLSGIATVFLIETLRRERLIKEDAAIGIVMTFLFSVAVLIISTRLRHVHLHIETVLLGQLEFVIFDRVTFFGVSLPASLVVMTIVLLLNTLFITLFYKEFKLLSFDRTMAHLLGFMPWLLHYLFMTLVSLTAVAAFNAVGAIMVIGFMTGPPASARLLSDRLSNIIFITLIIAIGNALTGYTLAFIYDLNIAASMATITLFTFLIILVVAPQKGLINIVLRAKKSTETVHLLVLLTHIQNHQDTVDAHEELSSKSIYEHFNWSKKSMENLLASAKKLKLIEIKSDIIHITEKGKEFHSAFAH